MGKTDQVMCVARGVYFICIFKENSDQEDKVLGCAENCP
jgi:hypothetical protein